MSIQLIYNSDQYCVVELSPNGEHDALRYGAYEIFGKSLKRELFIGGIDAVMFRRDVSDLIASDPSFEEIDDFLNQFEGQMHLPLHLH